MDQPNSLDRDASLERLLSGPLTGPGEVTPYTGEQLFLFEPEDLRRAQLALLQERFETLVPRLPALKALADENRITRIATLDEAVPLLFPHTQYKSYPVSLIANCQFDAMTAWLNDFTVHDLSGLDVSKAETIDEWLDVIEANTPVRVTVSSGTSGKCSLLPKSTVELSHYPSAFQASFCAFRDEMGISDFGGPDRYMILPRPRRSRHNTGRISQAMVDHYGGDESHMYTVGGEVSTDTLWLTGQMRKAQADGTFDQLKKTPGWKRVTAKMKQLEASARTPMSPQDFAVKVLTELKDKPVVALTGNSFLWTLVEAHDRLGLDIRFAPSSMIFLAGGAKLDTTTPEQRQRIDQLVPHRRFEVYGFGETNHPARKCDFGHYHTAPWQIEYILDRDTGEPLPRQGVQTGRYAAYDLWPQTYWGAFVTGDEATMNWDGGCPCGRRGHYLHGDVGRYTEKYGGDDKITCARTAAAVQEMMEHMRAQNAAAES